MFNTTLLYATSKILGIYGGKHCKQLIFLQVKRKMGETLHKRSHCYIRWRELFKQRLRKLVWITTVAVNAIVSDELFRSWNVGGSYNVACF